VAGETYLDLLRHEFEANEGSFLLQLRVDHLWDRAAFTRLTEAMRECCEQHDSMVMVERWLAEGYWFLSSVVRDISEHPNFRRPFEADYYARAYQRLWNLADWFFTGLRPYLPGTGFEPL
jgi:hypothetical protein